MLLLHVAIVYALVTGLAKDVIDVVRRPIESKVIEEKKPPPPPPLGIPAPEFAAPPPPYIPPPDVKIAPPPAPPIVAVTYAPPPAPVAIAAPAPPPPKPAPVAASVVCANYRTAMGDAAFPREALRRGLEQGDALIQFTLTADGRVSHVEAVHASNPVFARASEAIVATFECRGQGHDVVVQVPFSYRVE